jgi:hypothetical protein
MSTQARVVGSRVIQVLIPRTASELALPVLRLWIVEHQLATENAAKLLGAVAVHRGICHPKIMPA